MSSSILTVNTPASQNLVTLAAMRAEIGITDVADTSGDARLATLISQASAECAAYCQRVFIAETVTEVFPAGHWCGYSRFPTGTGLKLRRWPIQSVTSVVEAGVTLAVTTDYLINADTGEIVRMKSGSLYTWSLAAITVVYVGGYPAAAVPGDLARACMDTVLGMAPGSEGLALRQFSRIGVPGVIDLSVGAGASSSSGTLPDSALQRLARYQDFSFR